MNGPQKGEYRVKAESLLANGLSPQQIINKIGTGNMLNHVAKNKLYVWRKQLAEHIQAPLILTKVTRETWQDELPEGEKPILTEKRINGVGRLAILSDIHLPYHDKQALMVALRWVREFKPDTIILNGDIADFEKVSRFLPHPHKPDLLYEIQVCHAFFKQLRYLFKDSNIYFKKGNHELRLEHYVWRNAAALDGLIDFDKIMDFRPYGINHINNNKFIQVGKLNIAHGHELYAGAGAVNVAKVILDRTNDNIICGHFHRTQENIKKKIGGEIIGSWTTGCLQNLTVDYMPHNQWNHGFACVEFDKQGNFEVLNKKIINGKVL